MWLNLSSCRKCFNGSKAYIRRVTQVLQREVHNKLDLLEHLNKLYRSLAREGRTDVAGTLKDQVLTTNKRWDALSGRIAAILRRLKHILNIKDDFDAAREALLVWFAKIDVELGRLYKKGRKDTASKLRKVKVSSKM